MDALQHMKQLHDMQDLYSPETPLTEAFNPIDITNTYSNTNHGTVNHNCLCISIYLIDDHTGDIRQDHLKHIKVLLQKLSSLHSIIHNKIIPLYKKRYQHCWFTGGEGISFGMHCRDIHDHSNVNETKNSIPHLRAMVRYGSNIMDEYYALAMMYSLSRDLHQHYGIKIAIECWDMDDGHILLIEGANALPSWVDDEVGVQGMNRRVYVVNGRLVLIPPCSTVREHSLPIHTTYEMSRQESLQFVAVEYSSAHNDNKKDYIYTDARLDGVIQSRLGPFRQILDNITNVVDQRKVLKEHVHRASIVLPLRLALMIQDSPGLLLPTAIATFCRYCRDCDTKRPLSSPSAEHAKILFENLVVTTISIPKTLYAMLLTGAGQYPPPFKIPLHYKSIEMKRMKRKFSNGGEGFSHFRHALEAGIRLSLGCEWTMLDSCAVAQSMSSSIQIKSHSIEERIENFYPNLVQEAGASSEWIYSAWKQGPNNTTSEDNIEDILKCPVWDPEIRNGGLYPLSNPGKSLRQIISDVFNRCAKQEENSLCDLHEKFPMPRASDVDSDDWIDFHSIDQLEAKMNDITTSDGTSRLKDTDNINAKNLKEDDEKMMKMNNLFQAFDNFIGGKSDIGGISTMNNEAKERSMDIDSSAYLCILRNALKLKVGEQLNLDELSAGDFNDKELLSFFSKEDLEIDTESENSIEEDYDNNNHIRKHDSLNENDMGIRDLMMKMDEELEFHTRDRTFSDDDAELGNLTLNDPAVIKANVISNLMQSLDSQEGASGPISTILREARNSKEYS
jgi:hypothetical protein